MTNYTPEKRTRGRSIKLTVKRTANLCKALNLRGRLVLASIVVLGLAGTAAYSMTEEPAAPQVAEEPVQVIIEHVFKDGEGYPVDWEIVTDAWAAETGTEKRYNLTDAERWEVASVVTAEAQGEPYAGKVAVAQCILQASEDDGIRPTEAVVKYKYTNKRPEPSAEALEAVQAVFDFGHMATTEPIKYYYAPALVYSEWHETQDFVMVINGHRFFKEAE